jgi:hypothetical protein
MSNRSPILCNSDTSVSFGLEKVPITFPHFEQEMITTGSSKRAVSFVNIVFPHFSHVAILFLRDCVIGPHTRAGLGFWLFRAAPGGFSDFVQGIRRIEGFLRDGLYTGAVKPNGYGMRLYT